VEVLAAMLLFLSLGLFEFWPALTGKVPLPTDLILQFPAFKGNSVANGADSSGHSEMGDVVTQVYPWRAYARSSLRHGEIPLWNPYILSGTPFQANGQSALFYPPHWVFHILPMPVAWTVSLVLKIVLIGTFTFLLARAIGCSTLASMCSGVVLAMSGFFWCWLPWPTADAALWLPLMFYAVHRLYTTGPGVILVGFSYAMPILAGQPEIAFYVVFATTIFAFYLCIAESNPAGESPMSGRRFLALFSAGWNYLPQIVRLLISNSTAPGRTFSSIQSTPGKR
jgi:hypothetical protein